MITIYSKIFEREIIHGCKLKPVITGKILCIWPCYVNGKEDFCIVCTLENVCRWVCIKDCENHKTFCLKMLCCLQ